MHLKEKTLVGGCAGEENGWNTQLLYFTGSSLSRDDKLLFMISDKGGSPNIVVRDLEKGTEKTLTRIPSTLTAENASSSTAEAAAT